LLDFIDVIFLCGLQILLQHAGLVNLLSAPALAGFRTSMTEWRLQLQPLQDASSVSMFKKVCLYALVGDRFYWCS
jgi:hypothetical protein